jgi:glyoxylate/hydroxypyruvate reductase
MPRPGPILVYSIYESDIARFERLLAPALSDIAIACATSPEQAAPHLHDTTILYGWGFPPEMLERMPNLRWLQKMGAGVDDIIERWPFGPHVLLTRTDGALIAPRMAEYVLGAILDRSMGFDAARAQQQRHHWEFFEVGTIRNLTIGLAGLGAIGSMVAETLRALGARVVGWRRSRLHCNSVDELFAGIHALPRFIAACDVIVLVLPLTKDTKSLFGADLFARCRPGAHIINVGRGGLIDEAALIDAVEARIIAHATLDVFASEPLLPDHPFWENPHITITPHVCGPLVPEDIVPHFLANYAAFSEDRPLRNVIDLERQY